MNVSDFLGTHVSCLLKTEPFKQWPIERFVERGLEEPIIQYVFHGHAMALRCDRDDKISVIFLRSEKHNIMDGNLCEIPFNWNRTQVLNHLGQPEKSGARKSDPILGEYGAWDRFLRSDYALHVEYKTDIDEIKRITLMRKDAVP